MSQALSPGLQPAGYNSNKTPTAASPTGRVFRYRDNVYLQDGLALTGILGGLLYLILAVSMDSAGHVSSGMGIAASVTLGGLVLGALMSFSRFDSFFALSHSMFTGLAWILLLMAGNVRSEEIAPFLDKGLPELQSRVYFVLLRLLYWVDAALGNSASADNYVFIFEICFLLWWLSFLGMWSILRYGYIWRVVAPASAVLLINAYYAPKPVWGLLGLYTLIAFLLLIRTNLSEQQLRWREQRVFFSQDLGWDFIRTGLIYSVVVIAVAWLAPGLGRSTQVRQLLAPVNERWEQTSQDLNRLYQGLNRRISTEGPQFGRSLTLGGERNVGDSLVFNVRTATGRYWRAVVYDTYSGREWSNTSNLQFQTESFQPVPIAGWAARTPVTQTITLMEDVGNVVFGVPDVRQANLALDLIVNPVPAQPLAAPPLAEDASGAVEITYMTARGQLGQGDSYTVLSQATVVTQRELENAGSDYPAQILDRYVQIPQGFSAQVAQLAQTLTVSYTTAYSQVKAIESYLRTIPYNDAIAAPPPNVDPIEYFLFDIREGYCDYYATAMAMMVRSLGIPARTASGYAEGTFDEESGLYYVSERDAHTWVEVYFPGLGWIEFEPTAGESALDRPRGEDPDELPSQPNQPNDQQPAQSQNDPNQPNQFGPDQLMDDGAGQGETPADSWSWWLWGLLTPLILAIGLLILWRMRMAGPSMFTAEAPVLFFERLQRWGARLGWAPQATQTPYEQARVWSRALPEAQQPIRSITGSYVRHQFARRTDEPAAATEPAGDNLGDEWRKLEPIFWKRWLRRLLPKRQSNNPYELK